MNDIGKWTVVYQIGRVHPVQIDMLFANHRFAYIRTDGTRSTAMKTQCYGRFNTLEEARAAVDRILVIRKRHEAMIIRKTADLKRATDARNNEMLTALKGLR